MNLPVFVKSVWRFCLDGNSFAFFVAGDVAVEFWTGQTSFHSAASVFQFSFSLLHESTTIIREGGNQ